MNLRDHELYKSYTILAGPSREELLRRVETSECVTFQLEECGTGARKMLFVVITGHVELPTGFYTRGHFHTDEYCVVFDLIYSPEPDQHPGRVDVFRRALVRA